MRFIVTALVALAALWPANGDAAKKKAAPAPGAATTAAPAKPQAAPTPGSPRAVYAGMPEAERTPNDSRAGPGLDRRLQRADRYRFRRQLDRRRQGVPETQRRQGDRHPQSGRACQARPESARAKRQAAGWKVVSDGVTGARVGVPGKFAPPRTQPGASGTRWQSSRGEVQVETFHTADTTLQAAYDQARKQPANREVEYHVQNPDFFVVSGMQGGVKKFYVRGDVKDNEVRGVTVLYDKAMENTFDRIVVAISNAFTGFPVARSADDTAAAAPSPVGYASGVVVSGEAPAISSPREAARRGLPIRDHSGPWQRGPGRRRQVRRSRGAARVRCQRPRPGGVRRCRWQQRRDAGRHRGAAASGWRGYDLHRESACRPGERGPAAAGPGARHRLCGRGRDRRQRQAARHRRHAAGRRRRQHAGSAGSGRGHPHLSRRAKNRSRKQRAATT